MVMVGGRGQTESVEALEDRLEMPSAPGLPLQHCVDMVMSLQVSLGRGGISQREREREELKKGDRKRCRHCGRELERKGGGRERGEKGGEREGGEKGRER